MPSTRARLARVLLDEAPADLLDQRPSPIKTSDAAAQIGMTTKNARKHLEDLALLGMADRSKTSDADNAADLWAASAWLHDYWPRAERRCTSPPPTPEGGGLADASAETTPLRTSPSRSEPVPGRSALWLAQHPEEANA